MASINNVLKIQIIFNCDWVRRVCKYDCSIDAVAERATGSGFDSG